jgi:DNA mismatch repair protein MSH5
MIDLAQVSLALRGATSQSLIILDEFGKGTTSSDGAGLLAGVIDFLIEELRPRTIILTHFQFVPFIENQADDSELFANSLIPDDLPIVQAHMKTITPMNDDTRVTFLYK